MSLNFDIGLGETIQNRKNLRLRNQKNDFYSLQKLSSVVQFPI